MSLQKYLILPKLVSLLIGAPRDRAKAWETFWSRVRHTGEGGDVLWDIENEAEMAGARERLLSLMDLSLPIVDIGCGNGRFTRKLAAHFSQAVGVDVSPSAVRLAQTESRGVENATFRALDMALPDQGRRLAAEIGPSHAFVRGVLHVIPHDARVVMVENIRHLLGDKGSLYLVESDFHGDPLEHLVYQGATPTAFPEPLRLSIASGLRPPEHFGEAELERYFPSERWKRVASGPTILHTLPMVDRTRKTDELSALYAILTPHR